MVHREAGIAVGVGRARAAWAIGVAPAAAATGARALAAASATVALTASVGSFAFTHALEHFSACISGCGLHHIAAGRFSRATPNGLAAHGNGFGFFAWLGLEPRDYLDFNVLFGEALNVLHKAFFVHTHQIHGSAIGAGATGAADAVHIVFADIGNVVVHNVGKVINVNTAGGNVSGNQGADVPAFETCQGLGAGSLAFIAMQSHGGDAIFF
jgi:hypothetical protein